MSQPEVETAHPLPSERRIIAEIWPALLASALGLLPFTVLSTFLVPIADWAGAGYAETGTLRGLAGIGAVLAGVALAPLIGRIAPGTVAAAALGLMGLAAIVGTFSGLAALAVFCLATGVSNALLYPALSTAAADRFGTTPAAGRAATLVMTAQTLASTVGAPLLVLPALFWGWQGNLVAIAVVSMALIPAVLRYGRRGAGQSAGNPVAAPARLGYLAAFRTLAGVPGARALLLVSFGRAGAFMGHLAFLAPLYAEKFALTASWFAFVWSVSGGAFFLGHLLAGRMLNAEDSQRRTRAVMALSLGISLVALFGVYLSPVLPLAVAGTAVLSASHAVVSAAVMSLLVSRCTQVRGTALSLNAAGMSLGLFLGTAASGAALGAAGYLAAAAVLGALTLIALAAALSLRTDSIGVTPERQP
ncbi:MFS transporter [Glutamicibacter sp. ZJUTW]|uniref:MFS transporter n=1 Tax=Glutamicibacter sp. ZJUTW TaxID=1155384 RepID=UPI0011F1DF2D|nr:MFS transporter [Glutamicibacter sp. ZJUTW]QEP06724.1 MFS transporter [Glutamicibacter sp. ZJUTW]